MSTCFLNWKIIHWPIGEYITNQYNRGQATGWTGMIRVDGDVYTWMGLPGSQTVNQTAYEYTSTKSIFTMNVADAVELNVTFLSPITPNDFKRQSLVSSYLNVEVTSLDNRPHEVQVYSDVSAGKLLSPCGGTFMIIPSDQFFQNGRQETAMPRLSGSTVSRTRMLPITSSSERPSCSSPKPRISRNGVPGTGARMTAPA